MDRIVRKDNIRYVILAGDPQMDLKSSDQDVFEATLDRMREEDAKSDMEKVERLLRSYRANGLGVVGAEATLEALANGQVDELLISAALEQTHGEEQTIEAILAPEVPDTSGGTESDEPRKVLTADLLVTRAKQTDATVTFIEDASLLQDVGGVGGFLRWQS